MTMQELQTKYPKFPVKEEPLGDCPICNGEGEFRNGLGDMHVCSCACIGGPDHLRKIMAVTLQATIHDMTKALNQLNRRAR